MKNKRGVMVGLGAALLSISLLASAQAQADTVVYRLYNPLNGEHLYTTDRNERNVLYSKAGWGYEGEAWYSPDEGTPIYRLYNARLQNHLYTSDLNEINVLTTIHGWTQDNNGQPLFYAGGDVNIYRVYNRKLRGLHHWTTDENEYSVLPKHGWTQEGVAFKASQVGMPIKTQYFNKLVITPENPTTSTPALPAKNTNKLPERGNYTFTKNSPVRRQANLTAPVEFDYPKGQTVFYDQKQVIDGKTWISYMGQSGIRRYIMID